jgi:hypothetical protein
MYRFDGTDYKYHDESSQNSTACHIARAIELILVSLAEILIESSPIKI